MDVRENPKRSARHSSCSYQFKFIKPPFLTYPYKNRNPPRNSSGWGRREVEENWGRDPHPRSGVGWKSYKLITSFHATEILIWEYDVEGIVMNLPRCQKFTNFFAGDTL
ncbi:hypothetical protein CEXT_138211 [Caerostris extrusa]|uniref:Uncharacterized protein n=1 Tax=Caerostris extrusa TaxID=172846 RepID=A0AAV4QRK4_CAEEX|nr:hypothetical protein CEXT_138211 [Caerostris extrusa]